MLHSSFNLPIVRMYGAINRSLNAYLNRFGNIKNVKVNERDEFIGFYFFLLFSVDFIGFRLRILFHFMQEFEDHGYFKLHKTFISKNSAGII